jgi:hypothetical protein
MMKIPLDSEHFITILSLEELEGLRRKKKAIEGKEGCKGL